MKQLFSSIFKIFNVIIDVKNYLFLRRTIKKEKINSPLWVRHNLRYDWIGRIYTVMNLPPEVTMSPDLPRELYPAYLIDQSKGLNEYLTSLNLHEIITPEYKEIPDSTSYLLIYTPYFRALSFWWFFSRTFFWIGVYVIESKTHWFSHFFKWAISLF